MKCSLKFVHSEGINELEADSAVMGSTICVRCGETLIPHSYCDTCQDVLRFRCSSCLMYTDERIHVYCRNGSTLNNNNHTCLEDTRKLVQIPNSSQIILNDDHNYIDYYFNDEIKYNSINLFTSYWEGIFYSIKLANRYWRKIFNIGNHNQYISWKQD
ncbi:MAG TPA: hypothetical protein VE548_11090 [Nitrososphaeraceae archaeon]|nr:hypothetical protein [Nitrososphaeraceae archaeon]